MVPALIVGFIKTKEWIQKSDKRVLILSILIVFLAVFLLRSSHGRYLFPMSPFIFIFLLYFFKDYTNNIKLSLWILFAAWLVESLGLYFETSMEEVKMLISLCLLGLFVTVVYVRKKQPEWNLLASGVVVTSIAGISLFSALLFSYTQGQIAQMLEYGRHFEIRSITKELSGYDKVYINDTDTNHLIHFYMSDLSLNPQWKWNIKSNLPKSQLVKIYEEPEIINIVPGSSLEMSPDGSALVIIESKIGRDPFGSQELLPNLLSSSQLNLVKKVELKNKIMYIFENAGSN